MFRPGKWREFGVNVVNLGYCTNCEITKCPKKVHWNVDKCEIDGRYEMILFQMVLRTEAWEVSRERFDWAGLVLWRKYCKDVSDELKESKDEMRRIEGGWNGKEEWKASKVTQRRKGGEGNGYNWEIVFLAHKEICVKKAKHFFGEEIKKEEA